MSDLPEALTAPPEVAFCSRCGAPMETREFGHRPRRCCTRCRYVHFVEPRVGVGAAVIVDGRLLLVRRGMPPARGQWAVPAGYLDHGVDPREQVRIEVEEETGLAVRVGDLLDVFHNGPRADGASLFLLYRAELVGGRLAAGDDADDARFFAPDALPEVAFESTRAALRLLGARHHDQGE